MRILYFDIDGVLLSYDDEQRPALMNGQLQDRLKALNFDLLVCVSGWSDLFNSGFKSERQQKQAIYNLLDQIFTDQQWFLSKLALVYDTDARGQHIDLNSDWFYLDDWADKFFVETFGEKRYQQELGKRILPVDPHGDGGDILKWLDNIAVSH